MWICHSIERSISVPGRALALSPCGALAAESCCLVADAFPSVQERVQAVDVVLGRQLHHEGVSGVRTGIARPSQGCC